MGQMRGIGVILKAILEVNWLNWRGGVSFFWDWKEAMLQQTCQFCCDFELEGCGEINRQHGVSQSCPTLSGSHASCSVDDSADLGSTGPECPLGHGPLLSVLVYQQSLKTNCCCPEETKVSAVPAAPGVFFRLPAHASSTQWTVWAQDKEFMANEFDLTHALKARESLLTMSVASWEKA